MHHKKIVHLCPIVLALSVSWTPPRLSTIFWNTKASYYTQKLQCLNQKFLIKQSSNICNLKQSTTILKQQKRYALFEHIFFLIIITCAIILNHNLSLFSSTRRRMPELCRSYNLHILPQTPHRNWQCRNHNYPPHKVNEATKGMENSPERNHLPYFLLCH